MKKQNQANRSNQASQSSPASQSNPANRTGRTGPAGRISRSSLTARKKPVDQRDVTMQRDAKLRAVEKRKARSRSVTMTVFVLVIMIFTVFIILQIMRQTAPKPQFMFLQTGTLEHTVGSTGLLIREETLMKASIDGTVKPLVEEGNRVSFGQSIAIIIDKGEEASLSALKNCEQQISDLQRELINQGKGPGARVIYEEADKDIAELVDLIRKDSIQGTLMNINSYETSIAVLLERRDTRLLSIDFNDSRLSELKRQKENLEKTLGILSGTIIGKTPGIISYNIDGLEEKLTVKDVQSLTVELYNQYISESKITTTTGETVKKDEPILRITGGIYQCIAFLLPGTTADSFPADSVHTVKITLDGTTIENCKVIKTIATGNDLFVIFQTDRQMDRFSDRRTIQASITTSSFTGLKIPISAIIGFDKTAKTGEIMIVSNGYARISKINIIDYDREDAIIEGVKDQQYSPAVNGYLVKNPESVKEGENIGEAAK